MKRVAAPVNPPLLGKRVVISLQVGAEGDIGQFRLALRERKTRMNPRAIMMR